MITIVDYGAGNIGSVENMLRRLGIPAMRCSDADGLGPATHILLPGVGSFDRGMRLLRQRGLDKALTEAVVGRGVPLLGICLGMQLLADRSEEGNETGLGWIPGDVRRFRLDGLRVRLPIPHMGWNAVAPATDSPLARALPADARFYFVHSYHFEPHDAGHVLMRTTYGHEFASAVSRNNVYGVQFHPEKSHRFGMLLLQAFAAL